MTHLVNIFTFRVQCTDEEQAFQLRHSFQDSLQEQIVKVLDEVCEEYVSGNECIQIDKIEIDAGDFSMHTIYTDFEAVFRQKFREQIQVRLSGISAEQRTNSESVSAMQLFAHFIQTGGLPWWADPGEIKMDKIAEHLLARQSRQLKIFLETMINEQEVWTRLSWQLNGFIREKIISLFPVLTKARDLFEQWVWKLNEHEPVKSLFLSPDRSPVITSILLYNAPVLFRFQATVDTVRRLFIDNLERFFSINTEIKVTELATILDIAVNNIIPAEAENSLSDNQAEPLFVTGAISASTLSSKQVVKDAGIILIAPFFQTLFTNLGLVDKSGFTSRESAYRAVHLLKFIGTGQQQLPEYTMVLEKLLCGLPLDATLPVFVELTEREMSESVLLLQSVLGHWKGLRNTSLAGLRETFFRRDGIINRKENDWLLQVERKTLDVLLESLPWGYSTVSLPWNDYIIYTEW